MHCHIFYWPLRFLSPLIAACLHLDLRVRLQRQENPLLYFVNALIVKVCRISGDRSWDLSDFSSNDDCSFPSPATAFIEVIHVFRCGRSHFPSALWLLTFGHRRLKRNDLFYFIFWLLHSELFSLYVFRQRLVPDKKGHDCKLISSTFATSNKKHKTFTFCIILFNISFCVLFPLSTSRPSFLQQSPAFSSPPLCPVVDWA